MESEEERRESRIRSFALIRFHCYNWLDLASERASERARDGQRERSKMEEVWISFVYKPRSQNETRKNLFSGQNKRDRID